MQSRARRPNHYGRLIFFSCVLIFGALAALTLPRISIPLSISYVSYLILTPVVPLIMKVGLSRNLSIGFLIISILSFSTIPFIKIAPTISREAKNIEEYVPKVESYLRKEYKKITIKIEDKTGFELSDEYIQEALTWGRSGITSFLLKLPKFLASAIEWIFLIPLFVFFLLKDGKQMRNLILRITPNSIFERFYYLSHKFNKKLGDYILAKFIEAIIVGTIITIGLFALDIRFSLLFGLIAALTNVIPYLGPVIGSIPGIIFALTEYGAGSTSGAVAFLFLMANAIDIGLVFPILVSKVVDLHPILVVVSVILGSQAFGVLGMVISIPVAAAVKLVVIEIYNEIYARRSR